MNKLIFLLIKIFARLPFSVMNFVGHIIGYMFRLIAYRNIVISENLRNSFPKKSTKQISQLRKAYYRYFGRLIAESFKLFDISKQEIKQRITFINDQLIKTHLENEKEVIVVLGHYGNWEWALLASNLHFETEMVGIYKPLSNAFWNDKLLSIRSQFGAKLINMKESPRYLLKKRNKSRLIGIVADQTPAFEEINHSITFLNQKTAVFLGTEKLAKKLQCPVFFAYVSPQKFGQYTIRFDLISEFPNKYKKGELTLLHSKKLEKQIKTNPTYWLWSHRRWKHLR